MQLWRQYRASINAGAGHDDAGAGVWGYLQNLAEAFSNCQAAQAPAPTAGRARPPGCVQLCSCVCVRCAAAQLCGCAAVRLCTGAAM